MAKYAVRFKELRESKRLKQADIADLLHVTTRHYQEIEYGKINISMIALKTLADFYNVSMDYLICRTDNPEINY